MISSPTTYLDPVCSMAVKPASTQSLRWKGRNYHVCYVACRETFREGPGAVGRAHGADRRGSVTLTEGCR